MREKKNLYTYNTFCVLYRSQSTQESPLPTQQTSSGAICGRHASLWALFGQSITTWFSWSISPIISEHPIPAMWPTGPIKKCQLIIRKIIISALTHKFEMSNTKMDFTSSCTQTTQIPPQATTNTVAMPPVVRCC
jgi:hypothetical protein